MYYLNHNYQIDTMSLTRSSETLNLLTFRNYSFYLILFPFYLWNDNIFIRWKLFVITVAFKYYANISIHYFNPVNSINPAWGQFFIPSIYIIKLQGFLNAIKPVAIFPLQMQVLFRNRTMVSMIYHILI